MFERNKNGPEISKTKKLLLLICNLKQLMCSAYCLNCFLLSQFFFRKMCEGKKGKNNT